MGSSVWYSYIHVGVQLLQSRFKYADIHDNHGPGRRERRREVRGAMEEKDRSAKVSSSGMPDFDVCAYI